MISLILIFLSGIFCACMDKLRFHYSKSIFSKWPSQDWVNPSVSWTNKWLPKSKIGDLLMSTVFVFVTDFWHLCKFIMITLLLLAVVVYNPMINWYVDLFIYYCTFTITFELFFSKVLSLK